MRFEHAKKFTINGGVLNPSQKVLVNFLCIIMSIYTTKPVKELTPKEFADKIKRVVIGNHALDHLDRAQREAFEESELAVLLREKPRKVYLQANKRYAAYFRRKKRI